jgi:hypothetical protein
MSFYPKVETKLLHGLCDTYKFGINAYIDAISAYKLYIS